MPSNLPRPPYDPELEAILAALSFTPTVTRTDIEKVRKVSSPSVDDVLAGRAIEHERTIIVPSGSLIVSIFRSAATTALADPSAEARTRPGIFYTHGGGWIAGNRFLGIGVILDWVTEFDAVCVSVEYRIPPEHPDPKPIEDCYGALMWTSMNATELGINPNILMIAGSSAGGGLAAGTALLARDRGGPLLSAQVLICPGLDDRHLTVSSQQYVEDEGTWSRGSNQTGWSCYLGDRYGGDDISTLPRRARRTSPGCLQLLSMWAARKPFATKRLRMRASSGKAVFGPNCTSGPAGFTASICWSRTRLCQLPRVRQDRPGFVVRYHRPRTDGGLSKGLEFPSGRNRKFEWKSWIDTLVGRYPR